MRTEGKQPSVQSASDELGDYLRSPHCKSKDPLPWWKDTGEDSHPNLVKIAKDFLCISFSSPHVARRHTGDGTWSQTTLMSYFDDGFHVAYR